MGYVFLAAGVILIFLGSRIMSAQKNNKVDTITQVPEPFERMLSSDLILQKLNNIEDRLGVIEDSIGSRIEDAKEDIKNNADSDINSKIAHMMENGFTVDEISEKYGITKGEVLLRAGLKR